MENLRGIGLMIAAMAGFSLEDMFVKSLSSNLPVGQVLFLLGCGGLLAFGIKVYREGQRLLTRDIWHPVAMIRNLSEMASAICFILAIVLTPLSSASAILQATPLMVTLGAAVFLGEPVGWRRWSAIAIGFCGVLMVVRPGLAGFNPASLFAVAAVVFIAARDVSTRAIPAHITSMQLSAWAYGTTILSGLLVMPFGRPPVIPSPIEISMLFGALTMGVLGYYALIQSTRLGDMSAIAPFRYSRLIFALIIGMLVFSERPDFWTLTGSALIIASGLYTFAREERARQRRLSSGPPDL
ncbi:DMT family transporter [Pseudoruegeria sp. SK021]|uniref:DMT family transporter n=1 Tax=Pseudoruegeria sp. SK021 TaxID=1933035 RepID=UPI000A24AEA9|nr:DMT family transporter [Pseudoruegeria sp. SK021]OSP55432.1 EamA family transporter [Pseudoruegeria sp. SK021]